MAKTRTTRLQKRASGYYFRYKLPADVAVLLGRHEVVRSLKTSIAKEASELQLRYSVYIDEAIRMTVAFSGGSKAVAEKIFSQWFEETLKRDYLVRAKNTGEIRSVSAEDRILLEYARLIGISAEEQSAQATASSLMPVDGNSDLRSHLTYLIMRGQREIRTHIASRRSAGDFSDVVSDPVIRLALERAASTSLPTVDLGVPPASEQRATLNSLMAEFIRETEATWEAKTKLDYDHSFKLAVELWGEQCDCSKLTKANAREFKKLLLQYPSNATKKYPGCNFRTAVEKGIGDQAPKLAPKSINKKLSNIRSFFEWAKNNGFAADNVFSQLSVPDQVSARGKRDPFSADQIRTVFSQGVFLSSTEPYDPMSRQTEDYWIPLISYCTGMRLGEVAQLTAGDVRQVHDVWVFDVHERGDQHSIKTPASKRLVPVHKLLIELGLLRHRQLILDAGEERLFPRLEQASDGFESSAFSKRFSRHLKKIGVKKDRSISFHSFRHTMKDMLRAAGVEEAVQRELLGHEDGSAASGYGRGYSTSKLKEEIERIELPFQGINSSINTIRAA